MQNSLHIDENSGLAIGKNEGPITIGQRESHLRKIINHIVNNESEQNIESLEKYSTKDYTIEDKISYNCLDDEWQEVIYDFTAYDKAINETLNEDENAVPKKSIFLKSMNFYYKKALKELQLSEQHIICEKSTKILDCVVTYYTTLLNENSHDTKEFYDEMCVRILVAFGFAECKVLEKPC